MSQNAKIAIAFIAGSALMLVLARIHISRRAAEASDDACPVGHQLYLHRNIETFRGCIAMPGDCQFVAGILQEKEPLVRWYCR